VIAEQVEQSHGNVLAGCDGAPAADRMQTHRDAGLRQQVGILAAVHRQVLDIRIRLQDLLLIHFLFRGIGLVPDEIDRQIEHLLLFAVRQHVLNGAYNAFRLQIAASHPVRARVQRRHVGRFAVRVVLRIRNFLSVAPGVLDALVDRRAHFAYERQVFRERLVCALEDAYPLAAFQQGRQHVRRERPEHDHIDHADFDAPRLAKVIRNRFHARHHAALANKHIIRVLHGVRENAFVLAARKPGEFRHAFVGDVGDVVKEIRTLRRDALHVCVLVLHRARHYGVVDVPQEGNPAALVAVDDALRRCGGIDDVVRTSKILFDKLSLGQ